jgi:hypothetical protein
MRGDQWHAFIYPKNLELMSSPKILVPDIAAHSSFAFDQAGAFAFTSGYAITLKEHPRESPAYLLGLLNSRLLDFYLKQVSTTMRGGYFRYFTQFLEQLPIRRIDLKNKREVKLEREIVEGVESIQAAHRQQANMPDVLHRKIAHAQNRSPCNFAHYMQSDFTSAVKPDILIDDVQRTGFVHDIGLESNAKELTLTATFSDTQDGAARPVPVLRLAFTDDSLRYFLYASWRRFLAEHSRQKRWTKGKKPEQIYPLLVNRLEPLVYFEPSAADNLRAIREVMNAVAEEAGTADLAAVEAEIEKLDREIDHCVYELYELTPEEINVIRQAAKGDEL